MTVGMLMPPPHFYALNNSIYSSDIKHPELCPLLLFLLHRAGEQHLMHWTWNREELWHFLALQTECFPAGTALQSLSAEGHLLRDGNPLGQHMSCDPQLPPSSAVPIRAVSRPPEFSPAMLSGHTQLPASLACAKLTSDFIPACIFHTF